MEERKLTKEEKAIKQAEETAELLKKVREKKGQQLHVDYSTGDLKEIDEIKELIGKKFDDPEMKYDLFYKGIQRILIQNLPKGKEFKKFRDLIYDEKSVFLTKGKKKSDGKGKRGADSRMSYKEDMAEILDIILDWRFKSLNALDLYNEFYNLNEKYKYGHEHYDQTTTVYVNAIRKSETK